MKKLVIILGVYCITTFLYGQPSRWSSNKQGQWRFENHLSEKGYKLRNATLTDSESFTFKKNVTAVVDWFHQNHPMLINLAGYDMRTLTTRIWGDFTTQMDCEYGIPAEIGFLFELFHADGSKWTVEPPQYRFNVNAIFSGHDGFYFNPSPILVDDPDYKMTGMPTYKKAKERMMQYFRVYPLAKKPFPGVDIYQAYRDGWQQNGRQTVVIYNSNRPSYWLPVTVKEVADASLAYYSLFQQKEIDRMILNQLKQEIEELSPEELEAPAYAGHDSHFVLKVNGNEQGYQIMRFNPDYWDRTLPKSTIQFMTFNNANYTENEMDEQKNKSYPNYPQQFFNKIHWDRVSLLIPKK